MPAPTRSALAAAAALALALVLLLAPGARAQGAQACIPGTAAPICQTAIASVTFVADGDTLDVVLADAPGSPPVRVRIAGIQAMEQTAYSHTAAKRRGECHALEATARLEELVAASGGLVRLGAQDPASRSHARLLRSVAVFVDGQWQDVGRILIGEGRVLPFASRAEWAWNATYATLAQQVAPTGVGMWDPTWCGGPPAAAQLWVHWNAAGNDMARPDDEWVRVRNRDTAPLDLGGWQLRDSALNRFWFPVGTVVPAGGTITVQVGRGSGALLSWGRDRPIFDNVNAALGVGDGAFLFDPQGDLRAWMMYPCRVACADPRDGQLELRAQRIGRETISVRNTSDVPLDLDGLQLTIGARSYPFGPGSVVEAGDTLRVRRGSPRDDSALERWWPGDGALLPDATGVLRLSTYDGIVVACRAWGSGRC